VLVAFIVDQLEALISNYYYYYSYGLIYTFFKSDPGYFYYSFIFLIINFFNLKLN